MENLKKQWDSFDTKELSLEKTKDLLRLCGFAPKDKEVSVPRSFDEFVELTNKISHPMKKEELRQAIKLFYPSNFISYKNLEKYLMVGDKMSEGEMREFRKICAFSDKGEISVDDFVEFLYAKDE